VKNVFAIFVSGLIFSSCYQGKEAKISEDNILPESFTDYKSYLKIRKELLERDSLSAFDAEVVLSTEERQVNAKLIALRKKLIDKYIKASFFPPAHFFYKSKPAIEQTPLFGLLRQMPKGGILHLHSSALGDPNWVIDRAMKIPNCHVYWGIDNDKYLKGQLHFYKQGEAPQGFVPVADLEDRADFKKQLYDLITFDQKEGRDSVNIWVEFEEIFHRLVGFTYYKGVFKDYHKAAFDTLIADGVQHVEIRSRLSGGLYDLEHPKDYYNSDSIIYYLQAARDEVKREHPEFTLKTIYTTIRFLTNEQIYQHMIRAFELRRKYPEFVRGFDLVAHEDRGNTTLYYLDTWLKLDSLENAYQVDMPLYLHDGESDWASVLNLYDAVLLRSPRIGHGFNLLFFPSLLEKIKKLDICLEINPLSNQILDYVGDLRIHPANYFIRHGVQITINSDDPGIFAYNGLSYDYWAVFLAWQLDLRALKKLAMNSIEYSSLLPQEKQLALRHWQLEWKNFIDFADEYLKEINNSI